MYAVHVRNLSPTAALDKVPYHAWTGRKPDVSHLRTFGCTAYVQIPKKVRGGKLDPTAVKCRFLGWWADETKGYRLEVADDPKHTLITSRDVSFVEDESPHDLVHMTSDQPAPTGK